MVCRLKKSSVERRVSRKTHKVSRYFVLWWPPLRVGEDEPVVWLAASLMVLFWWGKDRSHGWDFFLFSLSASVFSCFSFLFGVTPMVPLFAMSVLQVSLLVLLWNSHNTVKNTPAKLEMLEIFFFFFNLKTRNAMPEIAGLSAGAILFEAVRQEIWCSRCHSEKVGGLKFNHLQNHRQFL